MTTSITNTSITTTDLTVDSADNLLKVDHATNRVGIGTTSPSNLLTLKADSTEETMLVLQNNSAVDIGSLSIHPSNGLVLSQSVAGSSVHVMTHDGNEDINLDSDGFIQIEVAGSELMRLNSTGVGIGTDDPFTKLHTKDTDWSTGSPYGVVQLIEGNNVIDNNWGHLVITDTTTANGNGGSISFATGTTSSLNPFASIKGEAEGTSFGGFAVYTRPTGGVSTKRLHINSDGSTLFNTTDIDLGYTNGTQGVVIRNDGVIQAARSETSVNNSVLYVNKLNGEGKLVAFYKDGAPAGSLGVVSSNNIFMASNDDVGIGVGDDNLYPTTGVGNSTTGILDIGDTSAKFRHVYASGKGNFDGGVTAAVVSSTAPSSPASSDLWFDTTSNVLYVYNGNAWDQLSNKYSASGGTKTSTGGYTYHTFLSSGTFTSGGTGAIEVLIVGGGGSGGGRHGGGGGGGGFLSGTVNVTATNYSIVVGGGGSSVYGTGVAGNDGGNSSAFGATANGGGGGGTYSAVNGRAGGSGGGAGHGYTTGGASNQGNSGGLTGYGNAGGTTSSSNEGSGGGGAGAAGANAQPDVVGGAGGAGRQWGAWDGYYYAAGGGGGGWNESGGNGGNGGGGGGGHASGGGTGGIGGGNARNGGGNGQSALNNGVTTYAGAGGANTGSGGGGSGQANHQSWVNYSGAGGSGIVIIRYPS